MAMEKVPMDGMPAPGEEVRESKFEGAFTYRGLVYDPINGGFKASRFENTNDIPDWYYILREINGKPVIEIDSWLFALAENLRGVEIPDSVTIISESVCRAMSGLKNLIIKINPNNPAFTVIDGNLYSKDGKTLLAGIGKGVDNEIFVVPDGVCTIGDCALNNGNYSGIIVPLSVKTIGPDSGIHIHGECPFPNKEYGVVHYDIYYKGTKKDWKKIKVESSINSGIKRKYVNLYFYSEKPKKGTWHFAPDGVTPVITSK